MSGPGYVICTIIAKNYVSFARTLCDSFLEHHPGGQCFVLIIDDIDGYIDPSSESFEVLSPEVLDIPHWSDFSFKYDITELATAIKPYLLEYLLQEKKLERLLYIDPDILILQPLRELFEQLEHGGMLLTPHLDTDYPDDGFLPNDAHVMKSGIYNLGFLGVSNNAECLEFLHWWQKKLYDRCVIDHAAGYFVDQKFIDYALPFFKGFKIISDVGYNVAYWNVHSRSVEWNGSEWRCNGQALYFYHFSGFKITNPDQMSVHQTRYQLHELSDLQKLFQLYISRLERHHVSETIAWGYGYNSYRNGSGINKRVRRLYRKFRKEPHGNPFDSYNLGIIYQVLPGVLRSMIKKIKKAVSRLYSSISN